jgi:hypothetical protein
VSEEEAISSAQTYSYIVSEMTYYTTASYSSINYSQLTTLLTTEGFHNYNNVTLNITPPSQELPPDSVYSFTEKIIIGIIAVIATLCTVIGNFMV